MMHICLYNYPKYPKTMCEKKNTAISAAQTQLREKSLFPGHNLQANFCVNFTSLKSASEREHMHLGTAFYRDLYTLLNVTKLLNDTFPKGTDIMDFAASNGEEAISIHSLLNDKNMVKYKIHCYDISDKAVNLAKRNIHSIFTDTPDDFLICNTYKKPVYNEVSKCFYELMTEIPEPDFEINDKSYIRFRKNDRTFKVKYFKVKDKYLNNFKFEKGDIRNILEIMPEKQVGAIFFRNAFYHLTNNHIFERIYDKPTLDKIWFTNKEAVIENVVSKVYEKLLPGGFFILGNDEKEHVYQADKYTPREDFYFDDLSDEYIRLSSPLEKALRKDGRFRPVVTSRCYSSLMGSFEVHTVWQKVDNSKILMCD